MKETNPFNNPPSSPEKLKNEDSQESFLKRNPFNSLLNSLQIEDKDVRYKLLDLDRVVRNDVESTLQDLSDQEALFHTMSPEERKGKNFDVSGLVELKEKYKYSENVSNFINNQVVPMLEKNARELFDFELDFNETEKLINEKTFEEECNKYAVDGEEYINSFLKENTEKNYDNWSWDLSKNREYIDMDTFVSNINEKYAPVHIRGGDMYTDRDKFFEFNYKWWGADKLREYLKGKKVVGVKNSVSLYLRVMSEITNEDIKDPFREKKKKKLIDQERKNYKAENRKYSEEREVDGAEYIKDLFTSISDTLMGSENFTWKLSEDKRYIKTFLDSRYIDNRFIMKSREIESFAGKGQRGAMNLVQYLKGKKIKAIDSEGNLILEIRN